MVAGDKEAVEVGLEIFEKGGNAIDVAAATILALTITDYRKYFCFGGEVPFIVYDAKRDVVEVLSGQGPAPELKAMHGTAALVARHVDGGFAVQFTDPSEDFLETISRVMERRR